MVRAAVLPAVGSPLKITGIRLPEPGPGQVRVRLAAAGVCHSDLSLGRALVVFPAGASAADQATRTAIPG